MTGSREARVGFWLCVAGAAVGVVGLGGWIANVETVTTILHGEPPMMPITAVALVMLGSAGALRHRPDVERARTVLALVLAAGVLALGLATIGEYVFGVDLDIDQLILPPNFGPNPGRPSPLTAFALAALAAGVCVLDLGSRRMRPSELLVIIGGGTSAVGLIGLLFGAGPLYRLASMPVVGMAMPTAIGLLLITAGLLLERSSTGVMAVVSSRGPGGVILRRLLPAAIVLPVLLGLAVMRLSIAWGVAELPIVLAIDTASMVIAAMLLLTAVAAPLNASHAALEASRSQLQSLIELAPEAIFVADLEGRYVEVNEAGCRMLGYAREDIVGKTIVDFIPPDQIERLGQSKAVLLEGHTDVGEWKLRHRDGRYIPVEVSARILADGRWQGFARDITERVRIERIERLFASVGALLGSSLQYRDVLPQVARLVVRDVADVCAIDIIEEDGTRSRFIAERDPSNRAIGDMLRLDATEPLLVSQVSSEPSLRALSDAGAQSLVVVPLTARGKISGELALISLAPSSVYELEDLRVAGALASRVAMSMENARLYATAQRAIKARDEVLGVVAHDLRNPLGIILMQAGMLREQRDAADVIKRAANRMNRLIRDLLDVTRIESGQLRLERAALSSARIVSEAAEAQRPLAAAKGVDVRLEVPSELPQISGDHDRLLQVFENLIGNALKFTASGGSITVGATAKAADVLFSVSDTGPGIAVDDQPRVFDRFWQDRNAARQGAGLGLQIVKAIVEAHDGRVWVESTPGHGATFFFTLPSSRAHAKGAVA